MAISATAGGTINNAVAGTTLTFSSFNSTAGQSVVVAVAILTTTASVSSVTDTALNTYTLQSSVNNSTNVRVELWACASVAHNASNVILVTLSGSSLASAAYEEYAGSTGIGNIGSTATGTSRNPEGDVQTQDTSSWGVSAFALASSSGDTFTANLGSFRQFVVPALTTAAVALVDNTSIAAVPALRQAGLFSASRAWAAVSLELRTGVAATVITDAKVIAPVTNADKGSFHQAVKAPPSGGSTTVIVSPNITRYITEEI